MPVSNTSWTCLMPTPPPSPSPFPAVLVSASVSVPRGAAGSTMSIVMAAGRAGCEIHLFVPLMPWEYGTPPPWPMVTLMSPLVVIARDCPLGIGKAPGMTCSLSYQYTRTTGSTYTQQTRNSYLLVRRCEQFEYTSVSYHLNARPATAGYCGTYRN